MRLRKLVLQNFRLHENSTLEVGDSEFVIVRGANASGKTSIAQALSLNLANTTTALAADGRGFASKIHAGEKAATIIAEIEGQHILENTVTLSVGSAGRTQTVKCLDAPSETKFVKGFENFMLRYRDALKIALNTDAFTRMDEKEQKSLLAKLVLPMRYDFPKEKTDAVVDLLGPDEVNFDGEPFSVIETAYKKLYKEREAINRQVRDFVIPEPLPAPNGMDTASLQKELANVRERRAKLQKDRDAALAKNQETELQRAHLEAKIDELTRAAQEAKRKLAIVEAQLLPDIEKYKAIVAKGDELTSLRSEHAQYLAALRIVNEQIEKLRSVTDKGTVCPTCDQPIDRTRIASLVSDLQKEYAQTDANLQGIDKKIEAIGDHAGAVALIQKHEQAVKDKEELTRTLAQIIEQGKSTREKLNALGEKKDAVLPFGTPLDEVQAQEQKLVEQLAPVLAAENRSSEIKLKTAQLEALNKKAGVLQDLVVFFDKDGIKKTLIAQYIGSFQNKLNAVLGAWRYEASLATDLSSFNVLTPRGYSGPVKELSGAEEHIFKVAFQCAVSSAAGIGLVVVDEVEEIGEDIRRQLYQTIYGLIQDGVLEQAILMGYSLDRSVPNPKAPGSSYWYVQDGTVERLDA